MVKGRVANSSVENGYSLEEKGIVEIGKVKKDSKGEKGKCRVGWTRAGKVWRRVA